MIQGGKPCFCPNLDHLNPLECAAYECGRKDGRSSRQIEIEIDELKAKLAKAQSDVCFYLNSGAGKAMLAAEEERDRLKAEREFMIATLQDKEGLVEQMRVARIAELRARAEAVEAERDELRREVDLLRAQLDGERLNVECAETKLAIAVPFLDALAAVPDAWIDAVCLPDCIARNGDDCNCDQGAQLENLKLDAQQALTQIEAAKKDGGR